MFAESKTSISKAHTLSDIYLCCVSDCGVFYVGDTENREIFYGATWSTITISTYYKVKTKNTQCIGEQLNKILNLLVFSKHAYCI